MEDPNYALKLLASGAMGLVWQWFMFGPKKIPQWLAWSTLIGVSCVLYFWATPSIVTDVQNSWRLALAGLVAWVLQAKGTGSALKAVGAAPASNSI